MLKNVQMTKGYRQIRKTQAHRELSYHMVTIYFVCLLTLVGGELGSYASY